MTLPPKPTQADTLPDMAAGLRPDERVGPLAGLPTCALDGTDWRYVLCPADSPDAPMLIAAHGSDRDIAGLVTGLGMDGAVSLLAPYFPASIAGQDTQDDYKFLVGGLSYLHLMDRIIASALERLPRSPRRIWLFGFSGGAQFAQRYALFRASRLDGLLLAAPGGVTLLRDDVAWWPGLAGAEAAIGERPDLAGLARLRTALLVGSEDHAAGLVARDPGTRFGAADSALAGRTRIERTYALRDSLHAHGAPVTLREIPGAGHQLAPCTTAASQVMRSWLINDNASIPSPTNRRST
ncbi:alpha/beta hydrolase [Roseicitreum antarcticum]|uniref:Esterase PHB depolymerase n=1 Tax=Roseicitreum antarcticum TaxID=564137 RepID=A0A1H2Z6A8_9RHOB|nr:alpha/beta hydrolase [Roseicitreum antarcticum]SDX12528.1 hypothetical protein SAMN04488238_105250 [Roseicitreum antarcticum]